MQKLDEIDQIYSQLAGFMTVREKIDYCSQMIFRMHGFLDSKSKQLSREAKLKTQNIIRTASTELIKLTKQ